jgi:signal peptidase I
MLKLLKVSGYSLLPLFQDGDYVLAVHPLIAGSIRPGDVLVFRHMVYGTMIKRVERLGPGRNELYVVGTHDGSIDSRDFGPIRRQDIIGKVIWHIKR